MDLEKEIAELKQHRDHLYAEALASQFLISALMGALYRQGGMPVQIIEDAIDEAVEFTTATAMHPNSAPQGTEVLAILEQFRELALPSEKPPKNAVSILHHVRLLQL